MFQFEYVYVPFGTEFTEEEVHAEKVHAERVGDDVRYPLRVNEIAADVGGECYGKAPDRRTGSSARMVFDHHFPWEDQFPSAASAVLHHTAEIKSWSERIPRGGEKGFRTVRLITHRTPDFDALCSLYLIRRIIEGELPVEGWDQFGVAPRVWREPRDGGKKIDWFDPHDSHRPWTSPLYSKERSYVWPLLLASYASRVDNCRPVMAPRTRALHSVLYAGLKRGRMWEKDGATEFFDTVVRSIHEHRLSPLKDNVFVDTPSLAPELALLDGEEERYLRDLKKARKTIVSVQKTPFEMWFSEVSKKRLLDEEGTIGPDHLHPSSSTGQATRGGDRAPADLQQFDGIYIRDPESLLFKEWARTDRLNSPMGNGFIFTAVAYSGEVPNSESCNTSRYIFSLDPERAGSAHLYNLWARLQAEEMAARGELSPPSDETRKGYEQRRVGGDPWFDGNNYRATIVDTPRGGTLIEPDLKRAPDLSDDMIASLAERELEYASFGGRYREGSGAATQVAVVDFLTTGDTERRYEGTEHREKANVAQAVDHPLRNDALRFVAVPLSDAGLSSPVVAEDIGRKIWPFLEDTGIRTVPTDFLERHLISHPHYVAVWNRNGIVIAHTESKGDVARRIEKDLRNLSEVFRELRRRTRATDARPVRQRLQRAVEMKKEIVTLKIEAAAPEMLPLRRLLESRRFEAVLSSLQSLDQEEFHSQERRREREQKWRDDRLQIILAFVAVFGLILAWSQVEHLGLANVTGLDPPPLLSLLIGILLATMITAGPFLWLWLRRKRRERTEGGYR